MMMVVCTFMLIVCCLINVLYAHEIVLIDPVTNSNTTLTHNGTADSLYIGNVRFTSLLERLEQLERDVVDNAKEIARRDIVESRLNKTVTDLSKQVGTFGVEAVSRNIRFNSSMTQAEIQAEIDSVHKYIMEDVRITFHFAPDDGAVHTYEVTTNFQFIDFTGPGEILITGNEDYANSNTAHTDQRAVIDGEVNDATDLMRITNCNLRVEIRNIAFKVASSVSGKYSLRALYRSTNVIVKYCYFFADAQQGYHITSSARAYITAEENTFNGGMRAYYAASMGTFSAKTGWVSGVQPTYISYNNHGRSFLQNSGDLTGLASSTNGGLLIYTENTFGAKLSKNPCTTCPP